MSDFQLLKSKVQERFLELTKEATHLFEVEVDKDVMWNDIYLGSFPEGTNEIFREKGEYDCSCCKQFIRAIGNVVVIIDNKLHTMWDFEIDSTKYQPVVNALRDFILSKAVTNIYFSESKKVGTDKNYEEMEDGHIHTWEHFFLEIPKRFVNTSELSRGTVQNDFRTAKTAFKRSLDEITDEAVTDVLELIQAGELHRGEEFEEKQMKIFLDYKKKYAEVPEEDKDNYAWITSIEVGGAMARLRNSALGTLLVNLCGTETKEAINLPTAVAKYDSMVAGPNFKRSKTIYTPRQLAAFKEDLVKGGYMESLQREYGSIDDITYADILYANKDTVSRMESSVFEEAFEDLSNEVKPLVNPDSFEDVETINYKEFVENILPNSTSVEALFENKHMGNMVSLTAPVNKDAKSLFNWSNGMGYAYTGNMADSSMKQRVKAAGGKVDGDLRFSIQWNEKGRENFNDFDAHCNEVASNFRIYYRNKGKLSPNGGMLDVDIIEPENDEVAVENIIYGNRKDMRDGDYTFMIHCFTHRGGKNGLEAELEFDGKIHKFDIDIDIPNKKALVVVVVNLKDGVFTIKDSIESSSRIKSTEMWKIKTSQFIPVTAIMYSPNCWEEENKVGLRHLFFMLKDCVNTESPNGFYSEFLHKDLSRTHRKAAEALGAKLAIKDNPDQLSGVGFPVTKRADIIVKLTKQGKDKVYRVTF